MNWYPGHMNKAKKEIQHALNQIDVVIELLDARVPYSSRNPVLQDLIKTKPSVIVFNKIDLAKRKKTNSFFKFKRRIRIKRINPFLSKIINV